MNTFQTLVALVLIIFVLSVIVQAIQEFAKALLATKANVMEQTLIKFMGNHLTLPQVKDALTTRGLDITALENFNKEDFRHLLDGIPFDNAQLQGIVNSAQATADQVKDNIAASYEAARASFQQGLYQEKQTLRTRLQSSGCHYSECQSDHSLRADLRRSGGPAGNYRQGGRRREQ